MLMDVFSSFDEQNFSLWPFFIWLLPLLPLSALRVHFISYPTRWESALSFPKSFISSQMATSSGIKLTGFLSVISSLFIILIMLNLIGLFPYVFSATSHLSFSFCLAVPLWLALICSSSFYSISTVISHFLPLGAPAALSPFLVLVETVSICVRPITLCIRLMANMSAGHIILGLIGSYLSASFFTNVSNTIMLSGLQSFYFLFEVGICLIQSYIFCLLLVLYADEHPMFLKSMK